MNKKFSTLVASLLFASAFSAFAGTAAPMFTAPNGVETRALVPNTGAEKVTSDAGLVAAAGHTAVNVLKGFTNNARLQVLLETGALTTANAAQNYFVSSAALIGAEADYATATTPATMAPFYFTLNGDQLVGANGTVLSLDGVQNFDIVPLAKTDGTVTSFFGLKAISSDAAKNGKFIKIIADGTITADAADVNSAAIFASVETAYTAAAKGEDLNKDLNDGFNLSVTFGTSTLKGAELFANKLTAMEWDGGSSAFIPAAGATTEFFLKNKDGKYIVFDAALNSSNAIKGGFKLVSATDAAAIQAGTTAKFKINVADNGAKTVEVTVDNGKRLYVNVSNGTNVLTALDVLNGAAANWASTALGATNAVDFHKFLTGQFYKVSFVKKAVGETEAAAAYKVNGILGLRFNTAANVADFVKAADVVAEDPSTMWAPSIVGGELVLTNRENTTAAVQVKIASLREVSAGVYEVGAVTATNSGLIAGEQIKITPVASVSKTDGYQVYADNALINSAFYLGQSRRNADGDVPAYWAENHGTHQIGATVNQEEATQWNVQLVKKDAADYNKQIDSVLVISNLVSYNATTGVTTTTPDTLAVLPYVFQNRGNREYVILNNETNQEYYICDKDNKNVARNAKIFALKKRPGNTYNYVTLAVTNTYTDGKVQPVTAINGDMKVYLKNSANKGTWENVETYSDDANSLMVVEPIDAPEYRKVVAAWGDTVRIYREEYPTEVLFEKADAKSVVDGKTLSFLNVNNSVTGANPALFVDTAYVNRTVNGVANTCYQYLLAVNVDKENSVYCPYNPEHNTDAWREEHGGPCADAKENPAVVKGRFLINLIDTAFAYKADHLHNNPYINMVEADENKAKLSFVEGIHTNDTLYITRKGGEVVKLGMTDPAFNVAKFAFRYVDNEAGSFKIQTQYKEYSAADKDAFDASANNEGYLRWVNGTVVVTNSYTNGEVFNMEENFKGNPVANEDITTSSVKVTTTEGKVIIAGAQGKKVTISNVLGQTIANAVLSSDKAEISTPSGVVIVAVEGEAAVKAIVK
ncbi:DUF6383 domain-containing protein [Parabacteroides gordonii]|jgi:hypothetical protein|uniref:DUF6383 domain-containing protein n=1 Tax=Parabacteroides gordonii MS-1 = DSM 23371 TaxID=1203610 RepID=A0A0F5JBZ1_9BACT|nr:DUF6383 domain-containing protein [Parabacteroides gordonii]KKB55238.1 hypothetical protein HMPREF1536_02698 [Parabacteroides gordonii MS-1 = DSM 23371]MCA5581963.1 DUF6383 domain-containing protein [Parabacteroides gordonii]